MSLQFADRLGVPFGVRKKYSAYTISGADWLGSIPSHWRVKPFKRVVRNVVTKSPEAELPFVALEYIVSGNGKTTDDFDWPVRTAGDNVLFSCGDVLFGKLRPYLKKYLLADRDGCCPTELLVLRPDTSLLDSHFLLYLVQSESFIALACSTAYGVKMPRTSWDQIGPALAWLPPKSEQRAIVTFLNLKISRLDDLIAKKQRLIGLLEEKRAALIAHSVSEGSNAGYRVAGLSFLMSDGPLTVESRRLKALARFVTSGSRGWADYYSDEGAIFLRIGNLSRTSIDLNLNQIQYVSPPQGSEGERTRICAGDVLVSITAFIGSVAVAGSDLGEAYVNQHLALIRPRQDVVLPRWLAYCLFAPVGQEQFRALLYGGTKDGLGLDDVRNLKIPVPSLAQQRTISAYLDVETGKIETLVAKLRETIERLTERRAALITAAVTGQIDVRSDTDIAS